MVTSRSSNNSMTVLAYPGDAKTLLAFNLDQSRAKNLAGFTIACAPDGQPSYYLYNQLQFQRPADHAQDPKEPPNSSINAPIHKFRWLHVPGSVHQGLVPFMGKYTYTVTPRYFDAKNSLLPLDASLSISIDINLVPFVQAKLSLGFARGFTQSQAFVRHFGKDALIRPKSKDLVFDTSQVSGANAQGQKYTFADEYKWLGFTARERIFEMLNAVLRDSSLHLDMFAYDLNEPDFITGLLKLAGQGRVRVILDNAALHHNASGTRPEDQFEKMFNKAKKGSAAILRGKFGRFAHDKVLIVANAQGPLKVLTGSTNFSVTGLYVNSNHVLVFDDKPVAQAYQQAFDLAWKGKVSRGGFQSSDLAKNGFTSSGQSVPPTTITFSPHSQADAAKVLDGVTQRIATEAAKKTGGSVLFAVMELDNGVSPVYEALNNIHKNQSIFSYGISDSPKGICLYKPGNNTGVLVSGKPASTVLPPPFAQVPGVGAFHQVHHKFVVCGFNQPDAVVYCGSSNLSGGGEQENGDNLLAIRDTDIATVFAIEALALVDHFDFLDHMATGGKGSTPSPKKVAAIGQPSATPQQDAVSAGWFLATNDAWTKPYFDPNDLKYADRILFGQPA